MPTEGKPPGRSRRRIRILFAILLSAGIVVAVIALGDGGRYMDAVASLRPLPLVGVAVLLGACNALRVWRLRLVVPGVRVVPLAGAALLHQFMVGVIPAKLGELALPLLLSRTGRIPMGQAFGVLLYIRLLDLAALLVVASVSVMVAGRTIGPQAPWVAFGVLVAVAGIAVVGTFVFLFLHRTRGSGARLGDLARAVVAPAARLSRHANLAMAGLSLFLWFLLLSAFHLACISLGIDASYGEVVASATLGNLLAALPVNGIGGIGATHLSWAGMLAGFGQEFEAAFIAGVAVQAMALLVSGAGAALFAFADLLSPGAAARQGDPARDQSFWR